jgi:hypothetical protein
MGFKTKNNAVIFNNSKLWVKLFLGTQAAKNKKGPRQIGDPSPSPPTKPTFDF